MGHQERLYESAYGASEGQIGRSVDITAIAILLNESFHF